MEGDGGEGTGDLKTILVVIISVLHFMFLEVAMCDTGLCDQVCGFLRRSCNQEKCKCEIKKKKKKGKKGKGKKNKKGENEEEEEELVFYY